MATVDINALHKIGQSMGSNVKDNTTRDQALGLLGGAAFQMLSNVVNTRRELKAASNATLGNAQYDINQLGVVGEGENAIDAGFSTDILNEQRKIIRKANNQISLGINTSKATANKIKAEQTVKNHVEGLKYVDKMMTTWNGIYKDGTVETQDKDGNIIKRKVKVNPASNATSQALGAAFADGSVAGSLDFRDGKWGIVSESVVPTGEGGDAASVPTFTTLENIQLPELDESSALHNHKKTYLEKYYALGGKSKNNFTNEDRTTLRKDLYNDYSQMSYNQLSSTWFAGSGTDSDSPAHQYVTQAGGYTFSNGDVVNIEDPFKLTDSNGVAFSEEQKAKRLQMYTAALEDLKLQDLDGGEKLDWFINNYAMGEVEAEFNKGFGDKTVKGGKGGKGGDLGRYLNINKTYSNDAVVRGYMDSLANGGNIIFQDGNGESQEYKPTQDGGYQKYDADGNPTGGKISRDRVAEIMGLPKFDYGSVDVGDSDGINSSTVTGLDLSGSRAEVRNKLLDKIGDNFTISRNWVWGMGKDIEIKHKSKMGEGTEGYEDETMQVGFNLGDDDALKKINKIIQKAGGMSSPSPEEKPVSETNPLG